MATVLHEVSLKLWERGDASSSAASATPQLLTEWGNMTLHLYTVDLARGWLTAEPSVCLCKSRVILITVLLHVLYWTEASHPCLLLPWSTQQRPWELFFHGDVLSSRVKGQTWSWQQDIPVPSYVVTSKPYFHQKQKEQFCRVRSRTFVSFEVMGVLLHSSILRGCLWVVHMGIKHTCKAVLK